jgi:hypothetical protein
MVAMYVEGNLRWLAGLAELRAASDEASITREAHAAWLAALDAESDGRIDEAGELLRRLLTPDIIDHTALARAPELIEALVRPIAERHAKLVQAIDDERWGAAAAIFTTRIDIFRRLHDDLALFGWAYAAAVDRTYGQAFTEQLFRRALQQSSAFETMWVLFDRLDPHELVLVLAEHLRGHLSGTDRRGSVEIIDEPDRYRLRFAPCGSGGALRARIARLPADVRTRFGTFVSASPSTWGRAGDVPIYCSHCADNERESIERLQRLAWVTEFDPDPTRPCGFTIYKDPAHVPSQYFVRLGLRPPERPAHEAVDLPV